MDAPRLRHDEVNARPRKLVPRRGNRIRLVRRRIGGPGRLQSVKQALPSLAGISKNFHNPV
jgi:hypothetical protein